jgi:hypothetical protein
VISLVKTTFDKVINRKEAVENNQDSQEEMKGSKGDPPLEILCPN